MYVMNDLIYVEAMGLKKEEEESCDMEAEFILSYE